MNKIIGNPFFRKVIEFFCFVLGIFNQILPKSSNKIIFFDSKSVFLNNYALYKYLINNNYNKTYKIYYCMPEIRHMEEKKENVVFIESGIKTVLLYLISKYCFFDIGNMRIKPSKRQMVINLWHGTPLKRIGFMSYSADKTLPKNMMNAFTFICVSASSFDQIYKQSFNLNEGQILHAAQPRLDCLRNTNDSLNKLGISKNAYKKIIMWMTTYRISKDGRLHHTSNKQWNAMNLPILSDIENVVDLNNFLQLNSYFLIIKIHRTSVFDKESITQLSNICFIFEEDFIPKDIQLYEILGECDALITDYSSVYFDYLILNRPICFIIEDIDEYQKINGFTVDNPRNYMPGPQITCMKELKQFLLDLSLNIDSYKGKRVEISRWCNEYLSIDNSKTLLNLIGLT